MLNLRRGSVLALTFWALYGPAARGAETELTAQEALENWIFRRVADYSDSLTREQRISLATHVPGLFGFRFVCAWKPQSGEMVAMIPGDTVESQAGGKLVCPGGTEVSMEGKAKVVLRQFGDLPVLELTEGAMGLRFGKVKVAVAAGGLFLKMEGRSVLQQLKVRPEKEAMLFLCEKGNITAQMETKEGAEKNYLASSACRISVQGDPDSSVSQILSGEVVQALNRLIPRGFRPDLSALLGSDLHAPVTLGAPNGSHNLDYAMLNLGVGRKAECALELEEKPGAAPKVVKTFTVTSSQGSVPLESRERGQSYFVVCEDETGAWSSSMLTIP